MRDLVLHVIVPLGVICLAAWPLAHRKSDQRRRDHITDAAYNLSAADIASAVEAMSVHDWQRAQQMRRVELTVARTPLDLLAAAEADRADWSQVEGWS